MRDGIPIFVDTLLLKICVLSIENIHQHKLIRIMRKIDYNLF